MITFSIFDVMLLVSFGLIFILSVYPAQLTTIDEIYEMITLLVITMFIFGFVAGKASANAQDLTTVEKLYNIRHDVPHQRIQNLAEYINNYSDRYNVDKNLVIAIIDVESDLYNVKGPTGESGYVQIKPDTFEQTCGYETTLENIIYDVEEQIRCGVKYISNLQSEHGWYGAISAYNMGTSGKYNSGYVQKVLTEYNELK